MILNDVIVEQIAIVASHLQGGVSHESLKGKCIAAAVNQILTSEGVPERMDRSPLHASCVVVLHNGEPQGILTQEVTKLIAEEVIRRRSRTNTHVIPKDSNHGRTERNDLNLAVLRVSEDDLFSGKVYILNLNVSHRGSPTTAVEKKVDDDPVAILTEVAVGFRLLQEDHEFFVCVNLFDGFGSLVQFDVQARVSFLIAPREEDLESAGVTVDGACGQPFLSHLQNHLFQVLRGQAVHRNCCVHSLGDGSEVVLVGF